jgi:hypothetical protein
MRRREAGRGAAPAGSCTQHGHSGGIGAPPATTTSPRQELADDGGVFERPLENRKARPGAEQMLQLARREASAAIRKVRGTIGLRFSARHPPRFEGTLAKPGCLNASR